MAVNTWVPSGCSGCAMVIGAANSGVKCWRTKIFFSLRLTKIAIGPWDAAAASVSAVGFGSGTGTFSSGVAMGAVIGVMAWLVACVVGAVPRSGTASAAVVVSAGLAGSAALLAGDWLAADWLAAST